MRVFPELCQIDALPSTELKFTVSDRNLNVDSNDRRFRVRNGVIRTFVDVLPRKRLWDDRVESHIHIGSHIGIAVLVERQTSGSMLQKQEEDPHFDVFQSVTESSYDFVRDQVTTFRPSLKPDGGLEAVSGRDR